MKFRLGGSFAPKLTPERVEAIRTLIEATDNERVRDIGLTLLKMYEVFNQTPRSTLEGKVHDMVLIKDGVHVVPVETPLEEAEIKRIWDYVPWEDECDVMGRQLDVLPRGALRDGCFHLLWVARELTKDREPMWAEDLQPLR